MKRLLLLSCSVAMSASANITTTIQPSADMDTQIDSTINRLIQSSQSSSVIFKPSSPPSTTDDIQTDSDLSYGFVAINDYLYLTTYWKKSAVFPEPAQSGTKDARIYKHSQDGISINSTKDYIEIKADNFDKITKHMSANHGRIPIFNQFGYRYPYIREGMYSYSFELALAQMDFYDYSLYRPLQAGKSVLSFSANTASVIGYRIGNGELKPILHDLKVYDYSELKTADSFMIYAKAGQGDVKLAAAAILVDKPKGLLRVYRTYPFPSK